MTYSSVVQGDGASFMRRREENASWPIHEVGRNADIFPPEAGRLLQRIRPWISRQAISTRTAARRQAHLEFGFKFFPKDYKPIYRRVHLAARATASTSMCEPNQANQELHAYAVLQEHTKYITFEPHLHAPGVRMCLEAIWGDNIQTLNCVGYDHNWVKQYVYADDAAPLLPKGTIVHLIGFLDTTAANRNPLTRETGPAAGGDRLPTCSSTLATRCRSPKNSFRPRWPSDGRT